MHTSLQMLADARDLGYPIAQPQVTVHAVSTHPRAKLHLRASCQKLPVTKRVGTALVQRSIPPAGLVELDRRLCEACVPTALRRLEWWGRTARAVELRQRLLTHERGSDPFVDVRQLELVADASVPDGDHLPDEAAFIAETSGRSRAAADRVRTTVDPGEVARRASVHQAVAPGGWHTTLLDIALGGRDAARRFSRLAPLPVVGDKDAPFRAWADALIDSGSPDVALDALRTTIYRLCGDAPTRMEQLSAVPAPTVTPQGGTVAEQATAAWRAEVDREVASMHQRLLDRAERTAERAGAVLLVIRGLQDPGGAHQVLDLLSVCPVIAGSGTRDRVYLAPQVLAEVARDEVGRCSRGVGSAPADGLSTADLAVAATLCLDLPGTQGIAAAVATARDLGQAPAPSARTTR